MTVFYIFAAIGILQGIISLRDGLRAAAHIRTFRPKSAWRPKVVVFCPCKGVDVEFRKNIQSILEQDYPHLRIVFVVESPHDPAFSELQALGATVLAAGEASDRGQKVH